MAIPTLMAAEPTVINAVYDKIWIEEIVISAPDLGGEASARVRLRKFRSNGEPEFAPGAGEWLEVKEIISGSDADPELAAAVGAMMTYVTKLGIENGVIAN